MSQPFLPLEIQLNQSKTKPQSMQLSNHNPVAATRSTAFDRTESFLTFLFAISVFVWKPGIYVSSGLIILYLALRATLQSDYRQSLWQSQLAKITLAMFALGLFTSAISANQLEDFLWMARKTMFLPAIVFFAFALTKQRNKDIAMTGLIVAFWTASLLTLSKYGWQMHFGGRMEGTWPQGTWDNLLGLFFVFLVLHFNWISSKTLTRIIYVATILMTLLMLLLAGGRGPWLAVTSSLALYFLVFKRDKKVIITAIMVSVIGLVASATIFQDRTQALLSRAASIANTDESSNWVRLQLWGIGIAHMGELIRTEPFKAVFGSGTKSYQATQVEFFKTMPYDEQRRAQLALFGAPNGDTHNNYLDSALRSGLLWTAAIFMYLIWLATQFSTRSISNRPEPTILLVYFLIMAIFYTVVPHFMSFFFVLLIPILLSPMSQQQKLEDQH